MTFHHFSESGESIGLVFACHISLYNYNKGLVFGSSTVDLRFVDYFCTLITYSQPQTVQWGWGAELPSFSSEFKIRVWGLVSHEYNVVEFSV